MNSKNISRAAALRNALNYEEAGDRDPAPRAPRVSHYTVWLPERGEAGLYASRAEAQEAGANACREAGLDDYDYEVITCYYGDGEAA